MNDNDFEFLKFYMEQTWEENRHLENLRERVTILVITLASAIIGFIVQQKFAPETKIFNSIVILLGLFGFLMTKKIFQIHQRGQKRLDKWYDYLKQSSTTNAQLLALRDLADSENEAEFPQISKLKHNLFWASLNLSIAIIGVFLFFFNSTEKNKDESQNIKVIIQTTEKSDTLKMKKDTVVILKK